MSEILKVGSFNLAKNVPEGTFNNWLIEKKKEVEEREEMLKIAKKELQCLQHAQMLKEIGPERMEEVMQLVGKNKITDAIRHVRGTPGHPYDLVTGVTFVKTMFNV